MENLMYRKLGFLDTKTFKLHDEITITLTIRTIMYKYTKNKKIMLSHETQLFISLSFYNQTISTFTKKYTPETDKNEIYLTKALANKYYLIIDGFSLLLDNFDQKKLSMIVDFLHKIEGLKIIFK